MSRMRTIVHILYIETEGVGYTNYYNALCVNDEMIK